MSYQLTAAQVPKFYVKFRSDDLTAFTHGFFRDAVRNGFRVSTAYRAEEVNGAKQTELIDRVLEQLRLAMQPYGVDRKSTRLNSSHLRRSRMPSSA